MTLQRTKILLKNLLGESVLGTFDYWRHPEMRAAWGGPFNGQRARAALFQSLVSAAKPRAIVETGTHRGTTTVLMAQTSLPVFTVESLARNYGFARARLFRYRNVTLHQGDSRKFIRDLFRGALRRYAGETIFAYLDAHGFDDLPLAEEIDVIFGQCPAAIVMIDDFQVPFDGRYGYDTYRSGKALTAAYIEPDMRKHDLQAFYPSVPASQETGQRRGCVVLAKRTLVAPILDAIPELRRFEA